VQINDVSTMQGRRTPTGVSMTRTAAQSTLYCALMDANEAGLSSTASLLAEDNDGVICAPVRAHMGMLFLLRRGSRSGRAHRRRRHRGSVAGCRPNKRHDFAVGLFNIQRDDFAVNAEGPIYDDRAFETRFLVSRSVFRRVYQAVKDEPLFQQRINENGRLQAHPLQKVVAAFRVIACGEAADCAVEYMRLFVLLWRRRQRYCWSSLCGSGDQPTCAVPTIWS